jgi:hypothetical protein
MQEMDTNISMLLDAIEPYTLGQEFKSWARRLCPRDYPQVDAEKLLAFRTWIGFLPNAQTERLALEIARLCRMPGFNLEWFRQTLRQPEPGCHQTLMLVMFGLATYQRWTSQHHLQILALVGTPKWRRDKAFGWQLYMLLVEAGFTSLPGEFLMASPAVRDEIIDKTIREAYQRDYTLLVALTREILFLKYYNDQTQPSRLLPA